MQDSWFVYVLRCADDSLYTGVTTDIQRRVREHNTLATGAKYTRVRRPVQLVHTESCIGRSEAQKREAAIKNMSRQEKLDLLKTRQNPL